MVRFNRPTPPQLFIGAAWTSQQVWGARKKPKGKRNPNRIGQALSRSRPTPWKVSRTLSLSRPTPGRWVGLRLRLARPQRSELRLARPQGSELRLARLQDTSMRSLGTRDGLAREGPRQGATSMGCSRVGRPPRTPQIAVETKSEQQGELEDEQ